MAVSNEQVKELRQQTGVGIMDCKRALEEADGDIEKAKQALREEGMEMSEGAVKKGEGRIASYIHHNGQIGVLVEVRTQTDFAANSDEVIEFADKIAMHVAAAAPEYVSREDVPEEVVQEERDIYRKQAEKEDKPEHVIGNIVDGKMDKFYENHCLMEQEFVGADEKTVEEVLAELLNQVSEAVEVARFARFEIGVDEEEEVEEELEEEIAAAEEE